MGRYLFVTIMLLASLGGAAACTSVGTNPETIIERSSDVRPAWADGDFSAEGAGDVFLTFSRTKLYRLELGIKQAQAAAVENSCRLVKERVRSVLDAYARDLVGESAGGLAGDIERSVNALETVYMCPEPTPRQVYWENLRVETSDGPRTHYDVYLLLTVRRSEFLEAMRQAANALLASESGNARKLGQHVLNTVIE